MCIAHYILNGNVQIKITYHTKKHRNHVIYQIPLVTKQLIYTP